MVNGGGMEMWEGTVTVGGQLCPHQIQYRAVVWQTRKDDFPIATVSMRGIQHQ
jgi:hypothetical protein